MTRILTITASPNRDGSTSTGLANRLADALSTTFANTTVVARDLGAAPPAHLDQPTIGAFYTPAEARSDAQNELLRASDTYVDELQSADVIILGTPMHNFGLPSALKAWIDQIARVGRTFQYTENGPEGLLKGKKVYVVTARGGDYSDAGPMSFLDHQVPYLKTVLAFVGLDDVTFINAEGVAMGEAGVRAAEAQIDAIATTSMADAA